MPITYRFCCSPTWINLNKINVAYVSNISAFVSWRDSESDFWFSIYLCSRWIGCRVISVISGIRIWSDGLKFAVFGHLNPDEDEKRLLSGYEEAIRIDALLFPRYPRNKNTITPNWSSRSGPWTRGGCWKSRERCPSSVQACLPRWVTRSTDATRYWLTSAV